MFSVFVLLSGLLDPEGEGTMFSFNSEDEGTMFSFNSEDEGTMFSFNSEDDGTVVSQNLETTHTTTVSHFRRLESSTNVVIEGLHVCLKVFWTVEGVKHDLGSKLVILVLKRCVRTNHETSVCI